MKRFISILVLSLMMFCGGTFAAQQNDTTNISKENKENVEDKKVSAPEVSDTTQKKSDPEHNIYKKTEETALSSLLPLISAILAVLALVFTAFVFFNSKSRYDELYDRYRKVKDDLNSLRFDISGDITKRIDSNVVKINGSLAALKDQILNELKSEQSAKAEASGIKAKVVASPNPLRFISHKYYGIYKSRIKGVYAEQMTEMREGNSTFEIVTVSDNEADVHLVEGLTKTQFSGLMGDAVQVTEGNPQSYETISEEAAGHMTLNGDVWTLTQKIKVKLS